MYNFLARRAASDADLLQTMQNMFAYQLGVFLAATMISYTNSNEDGLIFDMARSARRVQTVQSIFAHQLDDFLTAVIFSYTSSGWDGSSFDIACNARHMRF